MCFLLSGFRRLMIFDISRQTIKERKCQEMKETVVTDDGQMSDAVKEMYELFSPQIVQRALQLCNDDDQSQRKLIL